MVIISQHFMLKVYYDHVDLLNWDMTPPSGWISRSSVDQMK